MNEDYLWEKKGSDAEIESFEDMLSPLRYVPSPPPALRPEKIGAFAWLNSWLTPTTGALAAAGLVLAAVTSWQIAKLPSGTRPTAPKIAAAVTPTRASPPASQSTAPVRQVPKDGTTATTAMFIPKRHRDRMVETSEKRRKPIQRLDTRITKEEQAAYNQVMLALAIASDKLKIVSEAANGTED